MTYSAPITLTAENISEPAGLAATIEVTTSNVGTLYFEVSRLSNGLPLSAATVSLVNRSGRTVKGQHGNKIVYDTFEGTADENALIAFDGDDKLPLAEYYFLVKSNGYYAESGVVEVLPLSNSEGGSQAVVGYRVLQAGYKPRRTEPPPGAFQSGGSKDTPGTGSSADDPIQVAMEFNPFSYSWTVTETAITDTYSMTVKITYEAEIEQPEARLYVSPLLFCPGEDVQYLVANVGAFTMSDIVLTPNHPGVELSPDVVNIGTLVPGGVVTGTFETAGNHPAPEGELVVSATYSANVAYETSNQTRVLCTPAGGGGDNPGGGWVWSWEASPGGGSPTIRGTYEGSQTVSPDPAAPPPPSPEGTHHREQATMGLNGNAVLERQAFLATLELKNNGVISYQDVTIDIQAKNSAGEVVVGGLAAIPAVPTLLEAQMMPGSSASRQWTLIPGELGITNPEGEVYSLKAFIVFTVTGVGVYTTSTLPAQVTILPQPRLRVSYSYEQPDENGVFAVSVKVENHGYGVARKLKLDLSEVTVLEDLDIQQLEQRCV